MAPPTKTINDHKQSEESKRHPAPGGIKVLSLVDLPFPSLLPAQFPATSLTFIVPIRALLDGVAVSQPTR